MGPGAATCSLPPPRSAGRVDRPKAEPGGGNRARLFRRACVAVYLPGSAIQPNHRAAAVSAPSATKTTTAISGVERRRFGGSASDPHQRRSSRRAPRQKLSRRPRRCLSSCEALDATCRAYRIRRARAAGSAFARDDVARDVRSRATCSLPPPRSAGRVAGDSRPGGGRSHVRSTLPLRGRAPAPAPGLRTSAVSLANLLVGKRPNFLDFCGVCIHVLIVTWGWEEAWPLLSHVRYLVNWHAFRGEMPNKAQLYWALFFCAGP